MKIHTTNYTNTLIEVADDCKTLQSQIPVEKGGKKTVASLQFELLNAKSYQLTSDELLFRIFIIKQDLVESEVEEARISFFSKGQPCLRCSPLVKNYAWGFHFNEEAKVALVPFDSDKYLELLQNVTVTKVKAMRSSRK